MSMLTLAMVFSPLDAFAYANKEGNLDLKKTVLDINDKVLTDILVVGTGLLFLTGITDLVIDSTSEIPPDVYMSISNSYSYILPRNIFNEDQCNSIVFIC